MQDCKVKAVIESNWIHCPHCDKKQFPIDEYTEISNLTFRCKACKKEMNIVVEPRAESQEPVSIVV